jgi:chromate transporter
VNVFILYLVLLKATVTSFSGLASLPIIRDELVVKRAVLTDHQLNAAVLVGRSTPGPIGLYIVSVGYFVAGTPGAAAGWLALITPAFLVIPLLQYLGRSTEHPQIKNVLEAVVVSSAGLMLATSIPLAQDAVTGALPLIIAAASCLTLIATPLDTIWVILGSAALSLAASELTPLLR